MLFSTLITRRLFAVILALFLTACADEYEDSTTIDPTPQTTSEQASEQEPDQASLATSLPLLDVYKRASCGCCNSWIDHLKTEGFQTKTHNVVDLSALKIDNNIQPAYHSCHTAISPDGYVFEGHIPARYIEQFLREKPEGAIGLAVPGMPMGSPGMEYDNQFSPYAVLLLMKDGSSKVYARVTTSDAQYQGK